MSDSSEIVTKDKTKQLWKRMQELHKELLTFQAFIYWIAGKMPVCSVVWLGVGKLAKETLSKLVLILILIISQMAKDIHHLLIMYDSACHPILNRTFEWSIDQRVRKYRNVLYHCQEYQLQLLPEISLLNELCSFNSNRLLHTYVTLLPPFIKQKFFFYLIRAKKITHVKVVKDKKKAIQLRFRDVIRNITQSTLIIHFFKTYMEAEYVSIVKTFHWSYYLCVNNSR
jgi:hypothetical protein